MQEAVPLGVGAMAAILGMSGEAVEAVLEEMPDVFVANYNCPGPVSYTHLFAMKERYDGMVHFRNTYTYQVLSTSAGEYKEFEKLIQKDNDIVYGTEVSMIQLEQVLIPPVPI